MNRRKFLSTTCMSCITGGLLLSVMDGCNAAKISKASIVGSDMVVPLTDFEISNNGRKSYKKYIVIQNEKLLHSICIYRFDENNYQALWMQCTHQGAALQVFGDKLQCPAHGSEFNNHGKAETGPASNSLRNFPVTIGNNELKISLR